MVDEGVMRRHSSGGSHTLIEAFDATLKDGKEVEVTFDRTVAWSYDPTYGSDADGNRGVPMTFLDDDSYDDVNVVIYAGNEKLFSGSLFDLDDATKEEVEEKVEAWMKTHPPTFEEGEDDDGPEYNSEDADDKEAWWKEHEDDPTE